MRENWKGVYPAITTQMHADGSIDLDATAAHVEALIASGVSGIVFLGSLGENQAMRAEEKRQVMARMVEVVNRRVHVLSGVAETSTAGAISYARDVEAMGVDGLMLMPPMLYRGDARETMQHFRAVAKGTRLSIMLYNNPISYANDITPEMFEELSDVENFVAIKESAGNTRRITDIHNVIGGRYALFTGVDDLVLESAILGIDGWVAGSGIAFPMENQYFWELTRAGSWDEALAVYRWFTPLLHLDVHIKFIQYIKLAVQECELGREWTRAPRLPLVGEERERVQAIIREGLRTRPRIPAEWKPGTWR